MLGGLAAKDTQWDSFQTATKPRLSNRVWPTLKPESDEFERALPFGTDRVVHTGAWSNAWSACFGVCFIFLFLFRKPQLIIVNNVGSRAEKKFENPFTVCQP